MSNTLSPAGLTLTQARRVVWPFNRNRGLAGRTIGELLEEGQLTRRDLEWAAANARSHGLQNACRALLSHVLSAAEGEAEALSTAKGRQTQRIDVPPAVALILSERRAEPQRSQGGSRRMEPPDFAPQTQHEAPKPEPIPPACPVCGSAVRPDYRWTTRRRAGWCCDTHGLAHFLEAVYLPMLKVVYAQDAWVIPPSEDGTYPGVRRRDLVTGPIGYWPEANG
jgi:hypothetical protein